MKRQQSAQWGIVAGIAMMVVAVGAFTPSTPQEATTPLAILFWSCMIGGFVVMVSSVVLVVWQRYHSHRR